MSKGLLFWVLMILTLIFGVWVNVAAGVFVISTVGMSVLVWVLLALLGWQVFGAAIR